MSTAFELKQLTVRDRNTGAAVEGAVVTVFLDNGSGGQGSLAPNVFNTAGSAINQGTNPIATDAGGVARFRLPPGVYFLRAEWGPNVVTRPGFNAGMASARDIGTGAAQLPLPGNIPAALLGRAPNAGDAGRFFVFEGSGSYVLGALLEITPATGRSAFRVLQLNSGASALEWVDLPPGVLPTLAGNAGRILVVEDDGSGVEWRNPPEIVYPAFAGRAGQVLRVNSGESNVEWWNPNAPYSVANVSTAGNRTITFGDHNTIIEASGGSAINFILPLNSATPIPVGALVTITKVGSGDVSVSAASGVTLNGVSAQSVAIPAQWDTVTIYKAATNDWRIAGKFEIP